MFRLAQGEWTFQDSSLEEETSGTRLEPVAVVRAGRVSACTAAAVLSSSDTLGRRQVQILRAARLVLL